MGTGNEQLSYDPFTAILSGVEPGAVIARDEAQRFALIANDGVVEQLFLEAPGKFEVSDAQSLLAAL